MTLGEITLALATAFPDCDHEVLPTAGCARLRILWGVPKYVVDAVVPLTDGVADDVSVAEALNKLASVRDDYLRAV